MDGKYISALINFADWTNKENCPVSEVIEYARKRAKDMNMSVEDYLDTYSGQWFLYLALGLI